MGSAVNVGLEDVLAKRRDQLMSKFAALTPAPGSTAQVASVMSFGVLVTCSEDSHASFCTLDSDCSGGLLFQGVMGLPHSAFASYSPQSGTPPRQPTQPQGTCCLPRETSFWIKKDSFRPPLPLHPPQPLASLSRLRESTDVLMY